MDKKNIISVALPICSVFILLSAFYFLKPGVTGLAVYNPNSTQQQVDAEVAFSTHQGEIIPANAVIEVWLDDQRSAMSVQQFIEKSGTAYELAEGVHEEIGFSGVGYTGDYTYVLSLSDFSLDRSIDSGDHTFTTKIMYQGKVLYERSNGVIIS